jgi:hypothetical protein
MPSKWFIRLLLASSLSFGSSYVNAQTVQITPLGSHAGELCQNDRALIFEDPSGVRVLYDAGATIAGGIDPRLVDVHVILLSHAHFDHIGDMKAATADAGSCARPETVSAAPNSSTGEIAAAKNSAVVLSNTGGILRQEDSEHARRSTTGMFHCWPSQRNDSSFLNPMCGEPATRR